MTCELAPVPYPDMTAPAREPADFAQVIYTGAWFGAAAEWSEEDVRRAFGGRVPTAVWSFEETSGPVVPVVGSPLALSGLVLSEPPRYVEGWTRRKMTP